ncbi:MAG: hypothetical protein OHK0013_13670 [Sandaracinaceae bacterium]
MRRTLLALAAVLAGCGPRSTALAPESTVIGRAVLPRATPAPRPEVEAAGDVTVAVIGADAARSTLFDVLEALRDEDEDALRRIVTEETVAVHAYRVRAHGASSAPTSVGSFRRDVVVQRMLSARRVSRLPSDTPLDALVRPERIEVIPAHVFFTRGVPNGLRPGDLVVRFEVEELASRALLSIAVQGHGLLVVRVAPGGARIVGL